MNNYTKDDILKYIVFKNKIIANQLDVIAQLMDCLLDGSDPNSPIVLSALEALKRTI